jgi:hypothetical protein
VRKKYGAPSASPSRIARVVQLFAKTMPGAFERKWLIKVPFPLPEVPTTNTNLPDIDAGYQKK